MKIRIWRRLSMLWLIAPAALVAQVVSVNGTSALPEDTRPFGKYLIQVCTLAPEPPVPSPTAPPAAAHAGTGAGPRRGSRGGRSGGAANPAPAAGQQAGAAQAAGHPNLRLFCDAALPSVPVRKPQSITIKQVGCLLGTNPCPPPVYPLSLGDTFYVSATSDSGTSVYQEVVSGDVTPQTGRGLQTYRVTGPRTVVIRATAPATGDYAEATSVDLVLAVAQDADSACEVLGAPSAAQAQPIIDLPGILDLVGSPNPFVLKPQGKNTVFIYATRYPSPWEMSEILPGVRRKIEELAGRSTTSLGITPPDKPFSVELIIRHAAALGDPAVRIAALGYSKFTVQNIGSDRVRVTASAQPECGPWKALLSAIRHMEWQVAPEPLETKLYYLSASDVAAAFSSLAGTSPSAAGGTPSGGGGAPSAAGTPTAGGGGGGTPTAGGTPTTGGGSLGGAGSPSASGGPGSAAISVTQPAGSVVELRVGYEPVSRRRTGTCRRRRLRGSRLGRERQFGRIAVGIFVRRSRGRNWSSGAASKASGHGASWNSAQHRSTDHTGPAGLLHRESRRRCAGRRTEAHFGPPGSASP